MLGLLSGLGKGALEGKYEQRLLERKRFEEFQKQHMEQQLKAQELLPDEKEYISNVPRYQRAIDLAYEKLGAAEGALPDSRFSGYSMVIKLIQLWIFLEMNLKSMLAMSLAVT